MFLVNSINQKKRAVAYYRHSAEDKQENSVGIQREHAEQFAKRYDIEIIHEESDEGKSGLLGIEGRPGFKRLFDNWIKNPDAPHFEYVLVYDESRWGRFQDLDQAGVYTHECKKNGKLVVYVSNGVLPEGNELESFLTTGVKRYMSAKYSAELSNKVYYGAVRVSQQGFSAGGTACYGMVRLLLDEQKKPVRILKKGEHKAISNARVTFRPANDKTTQIVKNIFMLFDKGMPPKQIAELLNQKRIPSSQGKTWDNKKIIRILTNETYIGTRLYNKTWSRLKQKRRDNPKDEWIIKPDAFPGIIDKETFHRVQENINLILPKQLKNGTYAMRKAHDQIKEILRKFLVIQKVSEDDINELLNKFPIVYAVTLSTQKSLQAWCFTIPDELRKHEFIIGIGVSSNNKNPIHKVFYIPTNDLGHNDISVFSETDNEYSKYQLEQNEKIKEKVSQIAQELLAF